MPSNRAAYLTTTKARLEIRPAPLPSPADDEVVIRTRAIALNPVDHAIQEHGPDVFTFVTLPAILGFDVAGEVEVVGAAVRRFRIGDRVAGLADMAGFQEHVALAEHMTTLVPENISWEQAAVLPMGVSVATKALFHEDLIAAPHLPSSSLHRQDPPPPSVATAEAEATSTGSNGRPTVLIWGGATSVGSCAIQLAAAAGYDVVTTCSPRHSARARRLGARLALDYASPTVAADLAAALTAGGPPLVGALANAGVDRDAYPAVVAACAGALKAAAAESDNNNTSSKKKKKKPVVAMTMVPYWGPSFEGVECRFVTPLRGARELAGAVFHDYLPGALADGSFVPEPEAHVVGEGLEALQGAMDVLRAGVSAKKIVVTLG